MEEPVAVLLGALDVAGFVGAVAGFTVVEDAFGGDCAGEGVEEGDPVVCGGVEACAGGIVFEVEV